MTIYHRSSKTNSNDGIGMSDKLRILFIDYGLCNFHNAISLVESGHRVYVTGSSDKSPYRYYDSLGIKMIDHSISTRDSKLREWIEGADIDIIINTDPRREIGGGLTRDSARLETHKFFVRQEVEKLGILVPRLLDSPSFPCVMKPNVSHHQSIDYAQLVMSRSDYKDTDFPHYLEELIPDNIEANVAYAISDGRWSIMHTQEVIGEDVAKIAGKFQHWTRTSSFAKLSKENEELTLKNAKTYLDWAVQFGGDYVGQLTGLIKDGKWYFCENNSRPEQTNSLPYFITGDEWLDAMHGSPSIIGNAFPKDVQKMIVMPKEPDSIYPFHLHEKYGTAVPCGLDIIDGEYRVSREMRYRATDDRVGLVICDREIPPDFVKEFENNSEFIVSH